MPLPGQFVVVRLQPQAGAAAILRSYSLSGGPHEGRYRIAIKEEPRGVASTFLCRSARVGDLLDVSTPRGGFYLRDADSPVVLLSAGIGVTPVLAMLHTLAEQASPRVVWWIHGARNRKDHAFASEVRKLLAALTCHTVARNGAKPKSIRCVRSTRANRFTLCFLALLATLLWTQTRAVRHRDAPQLGPPASESGLMTAAGSCRTF